MAADIVNAVANILETAVVSSGGLLWSCSNIITDLLVSPILPNTLTREYTILLDNCGKEIGGCIDCAG
jgi:hypothetical protein